MLKKKKSTGKGNLVWILPAFLFLVTIIYYSVFYTFRLSSLKWDGISPNVEFVKLDNYRRLLKDRVFWKCLKNTLLYFSISFVIQNGLGFIFAAILHTKSIRFKTLYKCIIFIPYILAPATMAPVFRLMFSPQGMLQDVFNKMNLSITVDWLSRSNLALFVLMGIAVWEFTGMSFILFYAAMGQIDQEVLEAAELDGAGNGRTLISIVLPACKRTVISLAMLGIIGALKTFDIPYLVTVGGPNHATQFLGTYIYRMGIRQSHLGYAAALSVVLLVLAVVGAFAINKVNQGE